MKTAYGKLSALIALLIAGILLFAPMRFGTEDYLYAHPRSVRMSPGDSYALSYRLDSDEPQSVSYTSTNASVAAVDEDGTVTAIAPGSAQVLLNAEYGAKALVQIEVAGLPVSTLTLNTDFLSMEKGQITGLRATFNNKADNTLVRWQSADEAVATVDAVGRVCAVGGGRTTLTATAANGLTASARVSVHVSGNAIRISPEEITVGQGSLLRLSTRYLPADATDEASHWMSSDDSVLLVQPDGMLQARQVGQAVLSVFTRDGLSASTVIRVEPPAAEFDLSPTAATLDRGQSMTLDARFFDAEGNVDENAEKHYVTWTTSDPSVATVENGVVTAVGSGSARVSAAADGKVVSCAVRVQTPVDEVRLNLNHVYVLREQTVMPIQLEAELVPADADEQRLTWEADNDLVATVTQRGLVRLVGGYGTATVTARASSGAEAKFVVNVVAELPEGVSYPEGGE